MFSAISHWRFLSMGKAKRMKPKRLADKLLQIREGLRLSQSEMVGRLGFSETFSRNYISAFELGIREPPLPVLLSYARLAGVCCDALIDDELDLPKKLPGKPKH
jgi:transcriptional regulator with XRE-family HTH domain